MSDDLYWCRVVYAKGRGRVKVGRQCDGGELNLLLNSPPVVFPHAIELDIGEIQRGVLAYSPVLREGPGGDRRDPSTPELIMFRLWVMTLWRNALRVAKRMPSVKKERRR